MPRMGKKMKREWAYFIGENGRRQYNELCRRCVHDCKQSFRSTVVCCARYTSKRKICRD